MFIEIAIGAIGIGIVLMVGYIVIAQVQTALPGSKGVYNASGTLLPTNLSNGLTSVSTTVFAGFGLIAVGVIVMASFGIIQIFK